MKLTASLLGTVKTEPQKHTADLSRVAHLLETGSIVTNVDGTQFRVRAKVVDPDGYVFKLADLQGKPVQTPANFYPVNRYAAKIAAWLRNVLAYNEDWDEYVKSYIRAAGLPVDESWNWAKWFQKKFYPSLKGDDEIKDEAIHQIIITNLGDRRVLDPNKGKGGFAEAIKRFPPAVQQLPLEKQVTQFLLSTFLGRKQEANQFIDKMQDPLTDPMYQPAEGGPNVGDKEHEEYNVLDTEEHAVAPTGQELAEFKADMEAFRRGFAEWLDKSQRSETAQNFLKIWDIIVDWIVNDHSIPKISDIYPDWAKQTKDDKHPKGLGFDSMKSYYQKFAPLVKQYVEENADKLEGSPLAAVVDNLPDAATPAKAAPAKASSLKVAKTDEGKNLAISKIANEDIQRQLDSWKKERDTAKRPSQREKAERKIKELEKQLSKTADDISEDISQAKAEVVSPDTVDKNIQQPTEPIEKQAKDEYPCPVCEDWSDEEAANCHHCGGTGAVSKAKSDVKFHPVKKKAITTAKPGTHEEEMKKHPGAVCSNCGRTVTEGEYSYGGSNCCNADVIAEEFYGKEASKFASVIQCRMEAELLNKVAIWDRRHTGKCVKCGKETMVGPTGYCEKCDPEMKEKKTASLPNSSCCNAPQFNCPECGQSICSACEEGHARGCSYSDSPSHVSSDQKTAGIGHEFYDGIRPQTSENDTGRLPHENTPTSDKERGFEQEAATPGLGGTQGLQDQQNPQINVNNRGVPSDQAEENEPEKGVGPIIPGTGEENVPSSGKEDFSMKKTVPPDLPFQRLHIQSLKSASLHLAGANREIIKKLEDAALADSIGWSGKYQEYIVKRGYFYRHGMTAERLAAAIKKLVPNAIITRSDDNYHPWPKDSWFEVRFKVPAEAAPATTEAPAATEPTQQEEVMSEAKTPDTVASKRASIVEKIKARKASSTKFARLRFVAEKQAPEAAEALDQLTQAFGEMADRINAFRENLDLVDAPRTASLKTRIAARRALGPKFRQIATENPELLAEAVNDLFHNLDDVAAGLEAFAENMGIELTTTPAEEAFIDEGKEELEGNIPEVEKEEPKVDETEVEEEPKEANAGPGGQGWVNDRDESGKPKMPTKATIPVAQGTEPPTAA